MKRASFFLGVFGFVAAGALGFGGCASFEADICGYGICKGGSEAGDGTLPDGTLPDTKPDADPIPVGCDTPTDPTKNPEKCLTDLFGAYVSPTGNDANDGSRAKPFQTIAKALAGTRSRIVVCEGDYNGSVDVERAVELYGGATCDFTKPGAKPKVKATKAAYGLKIANVGSAVLVADFEVLGMNGAAPSESSVGVFASEAVNVRLLRMKIEAGDGAEAPAQKNGSFAFPADTEALKGTAAPDMTIGGIGGNSGTCPGGGSSIGGKGGNAGLDGTDANPKPPGGAKGTLTTCQGSGAGGLPGAEGLVGGTNAGAASSGGVTAAGFVGARGVNGGHGMVGGGGGGGGGAGGAGGGGGAGGCGGEGGLGGGAGGSSVAVLAFGSTVSLEATELVSNAAKVGGMGGGGQTGQSGGTRGSGSGGACNGGNGAKGGDGGSGGGGAGGISVAIAWSGGKAPSKDATTKIKRPTGTPPLGGEGGPGATKGVDGVYADVFEVK
jgi:hypothetical protein